MTSKKITISKLTNRYGGLLTDQGTTRNYLNKFIDDSFTEVPKNEVASVRTHVETVRKAEADAQKLKVVKGLDDPVTVTTTTSGSGSGSGSGSVASVSTYKKNKLDVDSRHRDMNLYPNVSDFYISTPKSYNNVVQIQLLSLEMPNVDSCINTTNNGLFWINLEDVDIGFPVYSAFVKTGSYSTDTLNSELSSILHSVNNKRRGGAGVPHYFIVEINRDTSYVNFTSIIPFQTGVNPFRTIVGSGIITVTQLGHGYSSGDTIYIIGAVGLIGGISSSQINGAQIITVIDASTFTFETPQAATDTVLSAGGTTVQTGKPAPFQFLFGNYPNSVANVLGMRPENSSVDVPVTDPLMSVTKQITGVVPGNVTTILCPNHGLKVGDKINLINFNVNPSVYQNDQFAGIFTLTTPPPSTDKFIINYSTTGVSDVSTAYVGTQIIVMTFPNHGFNRINDIEQHGTSVAVTTLFDNNYVTGNKIYISGSNSTPNIDGYYPITVIDKDHFLIPFPNNRVTVTVTTTTTDNVSHAVITSSSTTKTLLPITGTDQNGNIVYVRAQSVGTSSTSIQGTLPGTTVTTVTTTALLSGITLSGFKGVLSTDYNFYLYNVSAFGGFGAADLNNSKFSIREIIANNQFSFTTTHGFASASAGTKQTGGGSGVRINSKIHGWFGNQDNSPGGVLNKNINLAGESHCFLCCPNLGHTDFMSTGPVKDIFAKIQLTASPGFQQYQGHVDSAPRLFDSGALANLDQFHFLVYSPNNTPLDFQQLNYSMTLEITEEISVNPMDNASSTAVSKSDMPNKINVTNPSLALTKNTN